MTQQAIKTTKKLSQIGFGTYRLNNTTEEKELLKKAIQEGITVIDTAANYNDGQAEIAIGNVVQELIYNNELKRDDITIISKAGYLEGKTYSKHADSFKTMNTISKTAGYCLEPEFLNLQLSESLHRLTTDYIDYYLIQNPETYFINNDDATEETYYQYLFDAFSYLETEVSKGRITYYGISSNTFSKTQTQKTATSLTKLIELLATIPNHHFKLIQCPFNIIENDLAKKNNDESFFECAHKNNLTVITNRPLNAIVNNQLFKLVDVDIDSSITEIEVHDLIELGQDHESALKQTLTEKEIPNLSDLLNLFEKLNDILTNTVTYHTYKDLLESIFVPQVDLIMQGCESLNLDQSIQNQLIQYFSTFNQTAKELSNYFKLIHHTAILELKAILKNQIATDIPLNTISLQAYKNTPFITSSLLGIRTQEQLESSLNNLNHSILDKPFLWDDIHFSNVTSQ